LQNALVKIDRKDIKGHYQVKTNKIGHYFHAGLPLGQYKLSLEVNGKDVDFVDNVRTKFGDTEKVDFSLADVKNRQTAAAAGVQLTQEQARQMTPEQRKQIEEGTKKRQEQLSKNKALNDAFNAGMEAMRAKNWDAAIDNFVKASQFDPNQHVVWGNLADAYLARKGAGDVDKGIEAYAKAVALKGDDPAYHNNYALALAQAKKFDEAQAELTKAAQIDPPSAGKYYYNLGALYVNTGQNEPAGAAFKKAMDADPNYADAYYQYGLVLFAQATTAPDGKITPLAGTVDMFQKYLQLRPDGSNADAAKAMLEALGSKVETQFSQPKKQPAPKKK